MKKVLLLSIATLLSVFSFAQRENINLVDFETAGGYTTSVAEFTDNSEDYFTRTDGSNIATAMNFTNIQGSFFFGAHDTDGDGGPDVVSLSVTGIDISNYTDLELSLFVAEDDDGSAQDWDGNSSLSVEYTIDGSTTEIFRVEATGGTNTEPAEDTNFDGTGNGTLITDDFAQFLKSIATTGNTMDITITISNLEAGDEDIAIDNILVTGIPDSPAPVNLTSFTAKPMGSEAVSLDWVTASEENNEYFNIEHSTNGRDFAVIDQIEGANSVTETTYYNYTHKDAAKGMNYYRLKQVDSDGSFSFSEIAAVRLASDIVIQARPTLAKSNVQVSINEELNNDATIEVYDILGRQVISTILEKGNTLKNINVNTLQKGHYFVRVENGQDIRTTRFIKQ